MYIAASWETGVRSWGVLQSRKPGYYAFYCILMLELKFVWRMPRSYLPGAAFCTKLGLPESSDKAETKPGQGKSARSHHFTNIRHFMVCWLWYMKI